MKTIMSFICLSGINLCFLFGAVCFSQTSVTRIYTDHNGYFTSAVASPQAPDVSTQHLLAFQTGSTVWSTGVNDAVLTANSVTFSPQNFYAMPATVSSNNSNAVIGIGRQFGGYTAGSNGCAPTVPPPYGSNISDYLTDGIHGLDLSTAIFNIGGNIMYTVATIASTSIGDGIPDIIVTQTGDVNNTVWDKFRFLNASGGTVGVEVDVNFSLVSTVARPYWKFYGLTNLNCGASSAGTRDLRVLAFDFADLGITTSNYTAVTRFQHQLTPNSDVAFVAYNTTSIDILPVTLSAFNAKMENRVVKLDWQTASEINNDYFTVERSSDGKSWEEVLKRDGAGDSKEMLFYEEVDNYPLPGVSYYRLKQTDFDGKHSYSAIVAVNLQNKGVQIYPNPVSGVLTIRGENIGRIMLVNVLGQDVTDQAEFINNSKNLVQLDVQRLNSGYYFVHCNDNVYPVVVE